MTDFGLPGCRAHLTRTASPDTPRTCPVDGSDCDYDLCPTVCVEEAVARQVEREGLGEL